MLGFPEQFDDIKMKNILIPTDFSDNSHHAIRYALEYFADIAVNFFILHVSQKNPSNGAVLEVNHSALLMDEIKFCQTQAKSPLHRFYPLQEDRTLVESIRKQIAEKE